MKGHDADVQSVAWSPNGQWIASGSRDSSVRLWSGDGDPLSVFKDHTNEVRSIRWHPDSRHILSAKIDGTVRLWNTETMMPEWILFVLRDNQAISFSADGRKLAGDEDVFEREFDYLVEKPIGTVEIVTPSEFERRKSLAK